MKILFLLLNYSRDENHIDLYKELVHEFKDRGHEIYVAAASEKKNKINTTLKKEGNINVLRIRTGNMFEVNFLEKGITNLTLGNIFKKEINKYYKNICFDLVIHHTPPITFTPIIKYLKKKYKTISYLILRDIFPQNAKDLNIINNKLIFEFFKMKEYFLYKYSDYIGCMSKGNIEYIQKHNSNIKNEKFHILRNWGKIKPKLNIEKFSIRNKYNFKRDDFIVIFGGNMGKPQGLDFLLSLSKIYLKNEKIKFLIIGKGNEKIKLENIKKTNNLHNVVFLEFIPREEYELLVGACNLGIVSLHSSFTIPNIPSKTVDYCKLGLPILACTDKNTDYPKILEKEAKCGLASLYGDLESYKNNFEKLYNDKKLREELGKNGRKYYENFLGVDKAYETIMNVINKDMEEKINV